MRKLTLVLLLFLPLFSFSQDWETIKTDAPILSRLKAELSKMQSIRGDIRQEKSFSFLTDKLVSTGIFIYEKEEKLRWEFRNPIEYIILINENKMRLKEEGEEKKYKGMNQILRQVKDIILGCINGSIMDNSDYKTAFYENEKFVQIQLKPKAKNLTQFVEEIKVEFLKESSTLKKVTLVDSSGDSTDIIFSNLKTNEKVDENVFVDF